MNLIFRREIGPLGVPINIGSSVVLFQKQAFYLMESEF